MKPPPRNKISPSHIVLYKSFSSLIKDYREWRKLSQETLARSVRISTRELQNWEADRRRARIENLHDFSEVTGIPMQVCVALNADQPVWYSLGKRRFVYSRMEEEQFSIDELFRYREQSDEGIITKNDPITRDAQIAEILSCHHDIYGTKNPLQKDVIRKAIETLPDLNRIVFDCWGHYVGHQIILPIKNEVYQHLKKEKDFEGYLIPERISNIIGLHRGVFFFYSIFAANASVAYPLIINSVRFFADLDEKERYLIAGYSPVTEIRDHFKYLGMRLVRNKRDHRDMEAEDSPAMYELELDELMRPHGPFGALGWMIKEYDRKEGGEDLNKMVKQEGQLHAAVTENFASRVGKRNSAANIVDDSPLIVDTWPSIVDKEKQDDRKDTKALTSAQKIEACRNSTCTLYGKKGKGNIVLNGTYQAKSEFPVRRFLCKKCGKSFCSRTGTIFYDLRSPEERILKAFKLLAKGVPLQGVGRTLGVKRATVRRWLEIGAEQSEKIDGLLRKKLKVSQKELDALWTSVRKNSLRQRAILWKAQNTSRNRFASLVRGSS